LTLEKKFDKIYHHNQLRKKKMTKFQIIEDAKRQARGIFIGMAIPCQPTVADGTYTPIRGEKILKFNRKILLQKRGSKAEKADPRFGGGEDRMIDKVGKPGSQDRVEALQAFYQLQSVAGQENSAFHDE
jgi:hypothetical protein